MNKGRFKIKKRRFDNKCQKKEIDREYGCFVSMTTEPGNRPDGRQGQKSDNSGPGLQETSWDINLIYQMEPFGQGDEI